MNAIHNQDDTESIRVHTAIEPAPSLLVTTEIERRALAWIGPYSQAWHLERARDWLAYLVRTPRSRRGWPW